MLLFPVGLRAGEGLGGISYSTQEKATDACAKPAISGKIWRGLRSKGAPHSFFLALARLTEDIVLCAGGCRRSC